MSGVQQGPYKVQNPFLVSPWPGVAVWAVLYISDYFLTVKCARLYKSGAHEKVVMEGSYELTPYFQKDIDSFRLFSPRFILMLIYSSVLLAIIWMLSLITYPQLYTFALGAMVLIELTVHLRHFHNFFTFQAMNQSDAVQGRLEYRRTFILRVSATDLLAFAVLYLVLFGILQNLFFLGGTATCLSTALKHFRLFRKLQPNETAVQQSQSI